jgi:hypothetical protein
MIFILGINGFDGEDAKHKTILDTCQQFNVRCINVSTHVYQNKGRRGNKGRGLTHMCDTGEKDTLRGTRTHTFCYPSRCPRPVRLEGLS